jgi:hypothetical protein
MDEKSARALRWSLAFVWLATAAASLWEIHGQGGELLVRAGVPGAGLRDALVGAGALVDLVLGMALVWRPGRWAYGAALGAMGAMTLAATLLLPDLWLHPLGPLTKNIPIAAALWVLSRSSK